MRIFKIIFTIFFLFFFTSVFSQYKYLSKSELRELKNNYKIEENYIGGLKSSKPYFKMEKNRYDYIVKDKETFLSILRDSLVKGKVLYIPNNVEIDLTGEKKILINSGLTIIGDRGNKGKLGARLFTTSSGVNPLFRVLDSVVFKGLRIEGADKDVYYQNIKFSGDNANNLNRYKNPTSDGIHIEGSGFTLENCEISGWTHTGVLVKAKSKNNIFKFNYFHHNRRFGLGYGITVDGGEALIVANYFDFNRHDIAGTGRLGSAYEVCYNVFLSNTYSDSIDMHGGRDRGDGTDIAGDYMYVYNNYFERIRDNRKAAWLRGIPEKKSFFENNIVFIKQEDKNKVYNDSDQFRQINAKGNISIKGNYIFSMD